MVNAKELNRGIYKALILIVMYISSAILILAESFFPVRSAGNIIFMLITLYFYLSILLLVRRIMRTEKKAAGIFTWVIGLEIFRFLTGILMIFDVPYSFFITEITGIALLFLYFMLMLIFMDQEKDHILKIAAIRPAAFSVIIVFIVNLSLQLLHAHNYFLEMTWLLPLFRSLPFILVAAYLKRLKRTVQLNIRSQGDVVQGIVDQRI